MSYSKHQQDSSAVKNQKRYFLINPICAWERKEYFVKKIVKGNLSIGDILKQNFYVCNRNARKAPTSKNLKINSGK